MPPRHQGAGGGVTGGTSVISRQQLIGLVGITLMWGINWPMMKIALSEVSPMYFRGVTMGLGAVWLLFYFRFQGLRLWPPTGVNGVTLCCWASPICFYGTPCPSWA
jgi:drug/metabolite transporter (DMT)-like permease